MNSYQCCQVLGVRNDAPFKEIKSAYRKLALQLHPDKNMSERDGKKFKTITEAYQILRAEYKRMVSYKSYDTPNASSQKYQEKSSKQDYTFNSKKQSWWGARPTDKPPEEDWGRYTRETESAYQDFWKYYEKTFWEYYERTRGENINVEFEQQEVEEEIQVSTDVDKSLCIGCCSCETIAPTVFQIDKRARTNPKSYVINQRGASSEKILDAAQMCPTKAISVTDVDSKKQLFPW
ncbi:MAG: DnaJ domain-containing protein [Nitrosopumilaceae archaeon]